MRRSYSARTRACPARGQGGAKTIVRYGGKTRTFPMEGLPEDLKSPGKGPCLKSEASPVELIVIVVTRLSYGCPLQAIVHASDLDSRTVARGPKQAGNHCQKVHEERVMQKHL